MVRINDDFWPDDISDDLKNATITKSLVVSEDGDRADFTTYNITCEDDRMKNVFDYYNASGGPNGYLLAESEGIMFFIVFNELKENITSQNYTSYADVSFTISMP